MEIQEQLRKFKFHAIFGLILSILIYVIIVMAPRFLDLLGYFWPLLASTSLFIGVVLVFNRVSPPPLDSTPGVIAAEGLLDYVAGPHEAFGQY